MSVDRRTNTPSESNNQRENVVGTNSKIEWTHHTFNPWIGCAKVSEGCRNCYAERDFDKRRHVAQWGANGTRVRTAESTWAKPLAWNKAAEKAGERHRVFCASLSDVFEDRPELEPWRVELFALIRKTPHLDWLLLTKRPEPENVGRHVGQAYWQTRSDKVESQWLRDWALGQPPANVWIGTSVEDQQTADERIPHLLEVPARVRFLSCEPLLSGIWLLGHLMAGRYPAQCVCGHGHGFTRCPNTGGVSRRCHHLGCTCPGYRRAIGADHGIHWVIAGGESGPNARPMHPDWARSLRDQCQEAGVPFHFKQHGEWKPVGAPEPKVFYDWMNDSGGFGQCWKNADGAWKQAPLGNNPAVLAHVGKKAAGRTLDGREWDEVPEVAA